MERMKELIGLLNAASRAYYQEDREIMSNEEYDRLYDELSALERETGVVLSGSPTREIGYEVVGALTKVRHESRMLSLDKTKSVEKLRSFLGGREGLLSWKLDGLTIVLKYAGGTLTQAVTRGNGETGEDVTHNARVFANIPVNIPFRGNLVLRGEAIIPYSVFEKINENLEDAYKNPRNLTSGTVRQLKSESAAGRGVMFFAFALVSAEDMDFSDSNENELEFLERIGFETVDRVKVTRDTVEGAVMDFLAQAGKNDFASDGLVLMYDSISYGDSLGSTAKFPKNAVAFKWSDEKAETTLRRMVWNTSRTGLVNPVAVFDPVDIEGSTVERASVHNVSIFEELQLGVGDRLLVYKANMIIPQVSENLTKSGTEKVPAECPVCGGETMIRALKEGRALICVNPNCRAQRVRALTHFVSRDAMNIEGLSEKSIEKFHSRGFIDNYPDIFTLSDYEREITAMEGFGEKSFGNLMAAIERAKTPALPNFIYALGINQVGLAGAKLLSGKFGYDLDRIRAASEEELNEIDGFGEVISHSVHSYFHNAENLRLLDRALTFLRFPAPENDSAEKPLSGLGFVVTGDLEFFENRRELAQKIEEAGGKVTGSVTGKTACLITNDTGSGSAKNKKAQELNIPVLTEKEFIETYKIKP